MTFRKPSIVPSFTVIFCFLMCAVGNAETAPKKYSHSVDGQQREYLIFNNSKEPKPTVVVLHGWRKVGQTVRGERKLDEALFTGLDKEAKTHNFVTVYPVAFNGLWNLAEGLQSQAWGDHSPPDDIGFINSLVKRLVAEGIADPKRIYLTGFSNGTLMSYRLLCSTGNLFAAAAPVSGTMAVSARKTCIKNYLPPLFAIMGTADPILAYDGWLDKSGGELSIPEIMRIWSEKYQCNGQKLNRLPNASPSTYIHSMTWTGCQGKNVLKLYRIVGAGHRVASKTQGPERWNKRFGLQNTDIDTAAEIWAFFKLHTKGE